MQKPHRRIITIAIVCILVSLGSSFFVAHAADLSSPLYTWVAEPLFQLDVKPFALNPPGFSPAQMRTAYNLPSIGGAGKTIAIITAYDSPTIRNDLAVFSNQFGLPLPTEDNFEIHKMSSRITTDEGWALETALDVQWAHAIAPEAKILLVEAESALLKDLLDAVDYARNRPDVVSISMSWGGKEFRGQSYYNYHFISPYGASFFAASGDDGAGVIWPASSSNVIAVGGTTLSLSSEGVVYYETGWSGSGGGVSSYEPRPEYQTDFGLTTRRAIPDVSYNGNPASGVSVYITDQGWSKVGGTSAGSPQWAAIHALGLSTTHDNIYQRAISSSYSSYFRDITSGSNGYSATVGYDYVTGVGSPLTISFGQITPVNMSITLSPAGQTAPLSAENYFIASYQSKGVEKLSYMQDGTSIINVDAGTNVIISGTSTASTEQEKWVFNSNDETIMITAGSNLSLSYYQLLAQPISYAVIGGGNPQIPSATYYTAPSAASVQSSMQISNMLLSQTPKILWSLKGTTISVPDVLNAGSSERWITSIPTWTVTSAHQIPNLIQYTHQYLLTAEGAQLESNWYNSGEIAQITVQSAFNRVSGSGQRITSYSIDGNALTEIQPTLDSIQIDVHMDAPHLLNFNVVNQYQAIFDTAATQHIAFVTPPTINGDLYWYDQGTNVKVTLNSVTDSQLGTRSRLTSYTINTDTTSLETIDPINVLDTVLNSPQSILATTITQYQLSTPNGQVKKITNPTIQGDTGWYDAGTSVSVTYDYSWNQNDTISRFNAVSYQINQNTALTLDRSGNGTFIVQIAIIEPTTINIIPVTQYNFAISGSPNIQLFPESPTQDNFFDKGSIIKTATVKIWGVKNENTRQRLVSYTLDGKNMPIPESEETTFSPPEIILNNSHELIFNYVTQYLVSFQIKDNSNTTLLTPTMLQITTGETNSLDLTTSSVWLNNGTQVEIQKIVWQGVDIKPPVPIIYHINAPISDKISCQVYNTKFVVKDLLNLPISGARVSVTFANQTKFQATTDADGSIDLGLIPQGTFNATVSYLGLSTSITGNASNQPAVTAQIVASLSVIGIIVGLVVTAFSSIVFIRRRLSIAPKTPLHNQPSVLND